MSMVHRDGVAQNGACAQFRARWGFVYLHVHHGVYGSLIHVHVDGGLKLEQHDSVFVHLSM